MVFHLGYDYTLEYRLVCDGDCVDRSRMYLQLSQGIKGTLRTKKLGKDHENMIPVASLGNLLTELVAMCVGQLSADPGTSKSKGKEVQLGLRAEGVGHGVTPGDLGSSHTPSARKPSSVCHVTEYVITAAISAALLRRRVTGGESQLVGGKEKREKRVSCVGKTGGENSWDEEDLPGLENNWVLS
ncbi:hypothetical protein Sjap_004819 [Stephania japonica]|uniref:Uncharacterized protein n=1 Tax=Stephania japonica TaxID=461633 RepID=A0AAP0K2W1_9MAGN